MLLGLTSTWLSLLVLNRVAYAEEEPATITTAPVYLPYYSEESWSLVRGSVVSSDDEARETTYTIFCPDQQGLNPPECDLALEFPFVIVEGPETVRFHGTHTSRLTANLECNLKGTTEATCSGSSSFDKGYNDGIHTGPTEVLWTSTFTGEDAQWGVLTMGPVPEDPDPVTAALTTPTEFVSLPLATDANSAATSLDAGVERIALLTAFCTLMASWL